MADNACCRSLEHGCSIQLFVSLGYRECGIDAQREPDFEKIALYGLAAEYLHAARQLPHGPWTSKLGKDVDIEHDTPHDVAGGIYGNVLLVMKRFRIDSA